MRTRSDRFRRDSPVVIMTRGHSGSRVLAWALERLGVALGALESKPTGDIQDRRFTRRIKRIAIARLAGATDERATRAQAEALLRRVAPCKRWIAMHHHGGDIASWGWKFPETILIGPVVECAFPHARYIHLIRDGRDLAFKEHLTDDPTRTLGKRLGVVTGSEDDPPHIRAARSWAYQERLFRAFARGIPADRLCSVRFESMVTEPLATVQRCADFLGLPMTEACREYLADKVNPAKAAQHLESDPALVSQVESAIGDELTACGYELTAGSPVST